MAKGSNFTWKIDGPLPGIEAHTERKLSIIEQYLGLYFDTVTADPRMESLHITIIDGFCGGGLYQKNNEIYPGSPFVLLRAVKEAKFRLNSNRQKPLDIKARFFFSDSNSIHMTVLRNKLLDSEFASEVDKSIVLQTDIFEIVLPKIIKDINKRQRHGRSFFVLDQCGYTGVSTQCLRQIFENLDKPEAILTFSIDALINYLRKDGIGLNRLRQFGVGDEFINAWNKQKDDDKLGRATAQRMIMNDIQKNSGALFFTPFMMRSNTDNRWMLLAHLSKHQAARDKMLLVHWDKQNHFRHIGRGSLYEIGFDDRLIESKDALFLFHDEDEKTLVNELENELLGFVIDNMTDNTLLVSTLLSLIGNQTAAKNETLFRVLQKFVESGDLKIQKKDGGLKRSSTSIEVTDRIILPTQRSLFLGYP